MQETIGNIQAYDAKRDAATVFNLWETTIGQAWPIAAERFHQVLAGPGPQHFVAWENGQIVGFIATLKLKVYAEPIGNIAVLLVAPHARRRGIGTALLDTALEHFCRADLRYAQLGSISQCFWPGIPSNLPSGMAFFQTRGWDFTETAYDLVQDLNHYTSSPPIYQRMATEGISFDTATKENILDVFTYVTQEFRHWLPDYERVVALDNCQDILIARDSSQRIVGTLILCTPQSHPERLDVIWQGLLGEKVGAMNAVGVVASERKRGIGLGLIARGSDLLKERGANAGYVNWVAQTGFYARIGYYEWREYNLSWREI